MKWTHDKLLHNRSTDGSDICTRPANTNIWLTTGTATYSMQDFSVCIEDASLRNASHCSPASCNKISFYQSSNVCLGTQPNLEKYGRPTEHKPKLAAVAVVLETF